MIADALINGHILLADWSFLVAVCSFVALLVVTVLRRADRPADGNTARSTGTAAAVLPWIGAAAVAFGLLVL